MKFLELFKFLVVKQELSTISGDWVDVEDIDDELSEIPSNYIHEYKRANIKYVIIKSISRLGLLDVFNINWFDKISYEIITDYDLTNGPLTFNTKRIDCIDRQIDLQILMDAIVNCPDNFPEYDEYDEYDNFYM